MGLYRDITSLREKQREKNMQQEMATGVILLGPGRNEGVDSSCSSHTLPHNRVVTIVDPKHLKPKP